ncbi:hypothetical protein [Methylobrevis albus]|uniref:Uncharacterized protein n=1 Tax=Methylobrevis albus TaxID=2793297 RepID=A0A931I128_9HYPH|nr:hypothetical protein [Methylobrevis albus]MBH0236998.1 hypothetical protein [Methylobrevis albus]
MAIPRIVYGLRWRHLLRADLAPAAAGRAAGPSGAGGGTLAPHELAPGPTASPRAVRDAVLRHLQTRPVAHADLVAIADICLGAAPPAVPAEAADAVAGVHRLVDLRLGPRPSAEVVKPATFAALIDDVDRRIAWAPCDLQQVGEAMLTMVLRRHAAVAAGVSVYRRAADARGGPGARRCDGADRPLPVGPGRRAMAEGLKLAHR